MEKLIDEFIAKRCESILSNSKEYREAEKNETDSAIIQGIAEMEIYRTAFADGVNVYLKLRDKM